MKTEAITATKSLNKPIAKRPAIFAMLGLAVLALLTVFSPATTQAAGWKKTEVQIIDQSPLGNVKQGSIVTFTVELYGYNNKLQWRPQANKDVLIDSYFPTSGPLFTADAKTDKNGRATIQVRVPPDYVSRNSTFRNFFVVAFFRDDGEFKGDRSVKRKCVAVK